MRHQCIFPCYFAPVDGAFIGRGGCKNANARKNELAKTSEKTRYRWHNAHQCKAIQSSPNPTQAHRRPSYSVFYYFSCFSFLFLFIFLSLHKRFSYCSSTFQLEHIDGACSQGSPSTRVFCLNLALFILTACLLMAQLYCGTLELVDGAICFLKPSIFKMEYMYTISAEGAFLFCV